MKLSFVFKVIIQIKENLFLLKLKIIQIYSINNYLLSVKQNNS